MQRARRFARLRRASAAAFVVRPMNAALQRGDVHADFSQDREDGLHVKRFPGVRAGHDRDLARIESEASAGTRCEHRRGDERLCSRSQIDRGIDLAGVKHDAAARIDGTRGDAMDRLDETAPSNLDEDAARTSNERGFDDRRFLLGKDRIAQIPLAGVAADRHDRLACRFADAPRPAARPRRSRPVEMPTSIPSSRARRRAVAIASASVTRITSS